MMDLRAALKAVEMGGAVGAWRELVARLELVPATGPRYALRRQAHSRGLWVRSHQSAPEAGRTATRSALGSPLQRAPADRAPDRRHGVSASSPRRDPPRCHPTSAVAGHGRREIDYYGACRG